MVLIIISFFLFHSQNREKVFDCISSYIVFKRLIQSGLYREDTSEFLKAYVAKLLE